MATKFTLSLDAKVIEVAKRYSSQKRTSISKIIEDYLRKITDRHQKKKQTKNSLMALKGILGKVPPDFDFKEERAKYLEEKYRNTNEGSGFP